MPTNDTLDPKEAARIATNAYFTLKDWIDLQPVAALESKANIANRVLGPANVGNPKHDNTSLKGTDLGRSTLGKVHTAETGLGTRSGFGYTLTYDAQDGKRHVIIATRGTRPEMSGKPDLLTDARAAMASFGAYGPVHKGFKRTFDSILPSLSRDSALIGSADLVHCVGHSLGGAVATLIAGHYAGKGKAVKLYTFGSPRVGGFNTHLSLERQIGSENMFRVAHDLDPITLIGPYPYIHVLPTPNAGNNMTLLSPFGKLVSTANHDMAEYISSVGSMGWAGVRARARLVNHDDALIARWLLHEDNNPSWVTYASAKTLALLFKLFNHVLRRISTSVILGLTAVDLLAELLYKGLHTAKVLGEQILQLLRYAAKWAGVKILQGVDFTAKVISLILSKMLSTLTSLATEALYIAARNVTPLSIGIAGAWGLSACAAF